MPDTTLYERLGGYDAIAAVAGDILPRLQSDPQLGRFWDNRGDGGWTAFIGQVEASLNHFGVAEPERSDVLGFIDSTKTDTVE